MVDDHAGLVLRGNGRVANVCEGGRTSSLTNHAGEINAVTRPKMVRPGMCRGDAHSRRHVRQPMCCAGGFLAFSREDFGTYSQMNSTPPYFARWAKCAVAGTIQGESDNRNTHAAPFRASRISSTLKENRR